MDVNNTKKITIDQLNLFLRFNNLFLSESDCNYLLWAYDRNMDGYIDQSEFIQTTMKVFNPKLD